MLVKSKEEIKDLLQIIEDAQHSAPDGVLPISEDFATRNIRGSAYVAIAYEILRDYTAVSPLYLENKRREYLFEMANQLIAFGEEPFLESSKTNGEYRGTGEDIEELYKKSQIVRDAIDEKIYGEIEPRQVTLAEHRGIINFLIWLSARIMTGRLNEVNIPDSYKVLKGFVDGEAAYIMRESEKEDITQRRKDYLERQKETVNAAYQQVRTIFEKYIYDKNYSEDWVSKNLSLLNSV